MQLGIFARTYARATVEDAFEAVAAGGLGVVQMNLSVAGCAPVPEHLDPNVPERVAAAAARTGIEIVAVSGTFNMVDPDADRLRSSLRGLRVLAGACRAMGTSVVTLCTGSCDPTDMWRGHPDNERPETWHALLDTMAAAVTIAEEHDVTFAFEPESANVVSTARRARALLDEVRSRHLAVVIDPANLVEPGRPAPVAPVLDEAFDLLGDDIVLAHAKDVGHHPADGPVAAGKGMLDWDAYVAHLSVTPARALVLHGLAEHEVAGSITHLRAVLERHRPRTEIRT